MSKKKKSKSKSKWKWKWKRQTHTHTLDLAGSIVPHLATRCNHNQWHLFTLSTDNCQFYFARTIHTKDTTWHVLMQFNAPRSWIPIITSQLTLHNGEWCLKRVWGAKKIIKCVLYSIKTMGCVFVCLCVWTKKMKKRKHKKNVTNISRRFPCGHPP